MRKIKTDVSLKTLLCQSQMGHFMTNSSLARSLTLGEESLLVKDADCVDQEEAGLDQGPKGEGHTTQHTESQSSTRLHELFH